MLCAVLDNNIVTQVGDFSPDQIQVLTLAHQQLIDITNMNPVPQVGWIFDGKNLNPAPQNPALPNMIITRLAFRDRFTESEKIALYTAAQTPQGMPIQIYLDDLAAATYIDLSRADTIYGVNALAVMGIITAARANQILTTLPTDYELYKG